MLQSNWVRKPLLKTQTSKRARNTFRSRRLGEEWCVEKLQGARQVRKSRSRRAPECENAVGARRVACLVLRTGRPILRSRKRTSPKRKEINAGRCALFSTCPEVFLCYRMFAWFRASLCTCIDLSSGRLRGGRSRKNVPTPARGKSPEKQRCALL